MTPHHTTTERTTFYEAIGKYNISSLWEVLHEQVPSARNTPCVPAYWKYSEVWPYLMQSGQLITAEEAVRRALILENPALKGQSCITQSF